MFQNSFQEEILSFGSGGGRNNVNLWKFPSATIKPGLMFDCIVELLLLEVGCLHFFFAVA